MEFNIINQDATSFNEAVGLTPERCEEIGVQMDTILEDMKKSTKIPVADLMKRIAGICNNLQEYTYAVITHCNYMAMMHGIFYCLPKNFKELYQKKIPLPPTEE